MGKIRINITVDEKIHYKARELGLNISKTCENCLKNAIQRLQGSVPQTNAVTGDNKNPLEILIKPSKPAIPGSNPGGRTTKIITTNWIC